MVIQATTLHYLAIRLDDKFLTKFAHTLFVLLTPLFFERVAFNNAHGTPILNTQALTDLTVPTAAVGLSYYFRNIASKRVYLIGGFLALLGIFGREFDGNARFLIVAIEVMTFAFVSFKMKDEIIGRFSHIFNSAIAFWLFRRLMDNASGTPMLNSSALIDMLVIASGAFIPFILSNTKAKRPYWIVCHIFVLMWFLRELTPLENGQGMASIAWGVYAIALFIIGLRKSWYQLTKAAIVTLLVLVIKLFIVDLANLETLWRVLLFMGFGGVFLTLSYYFKNLWKDGDEIKSEVEIDDSEQEK